MTEARTTALSERADWSCAPLPGTCVLEFSDDERTSLLTGIALLLHEVEDLPLDHPGLLAAAEALGRSLPPRILRELIAFRDDGNDIGGLILRRVPVDVSLPPTPPDGMGPRDWRELPVTTLGQLAISSVLGGVIAYADEKAGRLVQDTIPVKGAETRQENSNSALLELHVEDTFHPFRPDFLTLHCLRGDHELAGLTVVGSMRGVLPSLDESTVDILRQPRFRTRLSTSFTGSGPARYAPASAILTGPVADPDVSVVFGATESLDEDADAALLALRAAVMAELRGTVLEPGDLMIVDNRRAVHGRTGFRPRYDGTDRWLRRCFTVADIRASAVMRPRGSRVCAPLPLPGDGA
ncbi:TauD/TfdA family dioxygenase [Amycolatopsis sp. NPDC059021]|uniref:TauD/TfdA family dioxygenase n=1 Tax=Amycolatopsis sp. NPDC059021 TaxID=3346704 RepID=UPI00366ED09A